MKYKMWVKNTHPINIDLILKTVMNSIGISDICISSSGSIYCFEKEGQIQETYLSFYKHDNLEEILHKNFDIKCLQIENEDFEHMVRIEVEECKDFENIED